MAATVASGRTFNDIALNYPAKAVEAQYFSDGSFFEGIRQGVDEARRVLYTRNTSCPDELIVLAGFSQGAMVMHRIVQELQKYDAHKVLSRMAGVLLIADGDRVPRDQVQYYGSQSEQALGIGQRYPHLSSGSDDTKFSVKTGRIVHSICHGEDIICASSSHLAGDLAWELRTNTHANGYINTPEAQEAYGNVARTLSNFAVPTPKGQSVGAQVGRPLSLQLQVSGGGKNVEWTGENVDWPPGLTLSKSGLVSGVPTKAGAYRAGFAVRAAKSGMFSKWTSGWILFSVTSDVVPPPPPPPPPGGSTPPTWHGDLAQVSTTSDGGGALTGSVPASSADGRYVALLGWDATKAGGQGIFVKDMTTGSLTLASEGYGSVRNPDISADGRYVVFGNYRTFDDGGQTKGLQEVLIRDLHLATTRLVSVTSSGVPFTQDTFAPYMSGDGRRVVFMASVVRDGYLRRDLYLRDLELDSTTLIAQNIEHGGSLSGDGNHVAFHTARPEVEEDTNGTWDVYVKDLRSGKVTRVSVGTDGAQLASGGEGTKLRMDGLASPSISGDGTRVLFSSLGQVYLHDLASGVLTPVATGLDGSALTYTHNGSEYEYVVMSAEVSGSGQRVAFTARGATDRVYLRDFEQSRLDTIDLGPSSVSTGPLDMSQTGGLLFFSMNVALVPDDGDTRDDVYAYRRPS